MPADYVHVPSAWTHPSCIHVVPNDATVDAYHGDVIQNGAVIAHYDPCPYTAIFDRDVPGFTVTDSNGLRPPGFTGWIEDEFQEAPSGDLWGGVYEDLTVPQSPYHQDSQTMYFFPGLESDVDFQGCGIIQAVLSWGATPIGGGQWWTYANWWVMSNNQYTTSPLQTTNVGHVFDDQISIEQIYIESEGIYQEGYNVVMEDTTTGAYANSNVLTESVITGRPCVYDQAYPATWESGGSLNNCEEIPFSPIYFTDLSLWQASQSSPFGVEGQVAYNPTWQDRIGSNSPQCTWGRSVTGGANTELEP